MARIFRRPRLLISVLLIIVAATIFGLYMKGSDSIKQLEKPEYLSFPSSYVFSVPKDYAVDEQSVEGVQLVFTGKVIGKTLDQIYEMNNISLQPITFLKDKKSETFKKYVNETFVPDAKNVLAPDVSAEFAKVDGWDVARVTVKKDGQPLRFIYLKNGQHPVSIVSKQETDNFKKIASSVTDVEETDLKNEAEPLKKAIQSVVQQLRDKKSDELHKQAGPEFRDKNTQDEITKLLEAEGVFTEGAIVVNGGSYDGKEFGAVVNFSPKNPDFKIAQGALYFLKVDGQWKLKGMQLPNPLSYRVTQ